MAEDHLYWIGIHDRWMDDENFREGPRMFFNRVPAPMRPFVIAMVRRRLRATLHGQGLGRFSDDEIRAIAARTIGAIADYLGGKPFFMGAEPTGIDATIFAFACAMFYPVFVSRGREVIEPHENLRRYLGRMTARSYPELNELAGIKAAA